MPQYEVRVTDRIPNSINQKLDEIAVSADRADMSVARLRRNLNFRSSGGFDRVSQSARTSATVVSNASRSVQNYQRRVTLASRANAGFAASTAGVTRTMRNLLVVAGSISLASGIVSSADSFREVDNRLSQVSTSIGNQNALYEELFSLAQETRVPIEELSSTFQRFDRVLGLLGRSQAETLEFTEILTKALIANGSTAQETQSAITQLSQGFNSLALQGDELRSIRENVPIQVLQALSEATGESVDQLKELGRQGRLTPSVIVEGFRQAADGVFESFDKIVPRFTERFIQVRNAISDFFRDFERDTGIFEFIGEQIFRLAQNIPALFNRLAGLAAGFAVFVSVPASISLVTSAVTGLTTSVTLLGAAFGILGVISIAVGAIVAFRNELTLTEDGVVTLGDVVSTVWNDITGTVQRSSSETNKALNDSFELEESTTTNLITQIGELAEGLVLGVTSAGAALSGILFGVARVLISGLGSIVNGGVLLLLRGIRSFVTDFGPVIEDFINDTIDTVNPLIERLNQLGLTNVQPFANVDLNLDDSLTQVNQGISDAQTALNENLEVFTNPLNTIRETVDESLRLNESAVTEFFQPIRDGYNDLIERSRVSAEARLAEEQRLADEIEAGRQRLNDAREQTLFESQPNSQVASAQQEQLTAAQRINQELQFQSGFILDSVNANRELSNSFNDVGSAANDSLSSAMEGLESLGNQGMDVSMSIAQGFNESFEGLGSLLDGDIEEGLPQLLRGISQIGTAFQQQRAMQEQIQGQAQALQNQQGSNSNAIPGFNRALAGNFLRQGDPGGADAFNQNQRFRVQQLQSGFGQRLQGQQGQSNVAQVGQDAQQAQQQIDQATESVNRFSQAAGINSQQGITGQAQNQQGYSLFGGGENQTQSIQTTQQALQMLLTTSQEANTAIQMLAMIDFTQLSTSVQTSSQSFNMLPQAASQAASGVESSMDQILASLDEVIDRANQAASAVAGVGGGGGGLFGGGGGGGLFGGFMRGGFTGNVSRRRVAGVVHGREYVVNAGATRGNRAALEQLNRTGSLPSGGGRSGGVTINNNAGAVISTSNDSNGDLMIEVDRRIERQNQSLDGRLAALTTNPNSRFSKSLRNNTQGGSRRRSG